MKRYECASSNERSTHLTVFNSGSWFIFLGTIYACSIGLAPLFHFSIFLLAIAFATEIHVIWFSIARILCIRFTFLGVFDQGSVCSHHGFELENLGSWLLKKAGLKLKEIHLTPWQPLQLIPAASCSFHVQKPRKGTKEWIVGQGFMRLRASFVAYRSLVKILPKVKPTREFRLRAFKKYRTCSLSFSFKICRNRTPIIRADVVFIPTTFQTTMLLEFVVKLNGFEILNPALSILAV